jgi:hypothetical protein
MLQAFLIGSTGFLICFDFINVFQQFAIRDLLQGGPQDLLKKNYIMLFLKVPISSTECNKAITLYEVHRTLSLCCIQWTICSYWLCSYVLLVSNFQNEWSCRFVCFRRYVYGFCGVFRLWLKFSIGFGSETFSILI